MRGERYQMGKIVGTGAFATVHEATDLRLDSIVAIKVLAQNWAADPSVCERFGREATLLRRVRSRHRNAPLAEVFDIDQAEDGRPYFVMSFADRGTLSARITPGDAWGFDDVEPIIATLTDGLHALHSEGVVHRDIKPSNMLYVSQPAAPSGEELLIGDLGLAKDTLTATSELTVAGGTPGYMAPEQRFPDSQITPAADVYSSTVLIAELLTGVRGPEAIDALPAHIQPEFRRGTAPDPADRHSTMVQWRERITAAITNAAITNADGTVVAPTAPPPPPPVQQQQPTVATMQPVPGNAPEAPSPVALGAGAPPEKRRVAPALIFLAGALVGLAVLGGLAVMMFAGPSSRIVGPSTAEVGTTIFLRPELPEDARSHTWTVGGENVSQMDLRLTPNEPGTVVVELVVVLADASTETATHTIEVS